MGLARGQPKGAAAQHGGGDARHNWLGLDMQVPIKLVGAPAADETDPVTVHTCTEESHGSASAGGACRDGTERVGRIWVSKGRGQRGDTA